MNDNWLIDKLSDDIDMYGTDIDVYSLRSIENGKFEDYYLKLTSLPNAIEQRINRLESVRINLGLLFEEVKRFIDK